MTDLKESVNDDIAQLKARLEEMQLSFERQGTSKLHKQIKMINEKLTKVDNIQTAEEMKKKK